MAGRGRGRGNRNQQGNDDDPLASVLAGLGGLALLGGAAYAATRIFSGGEQEEPSSTRAGGGQSRQNLTSSSVSSVFGALDYSRSANGTTITIAVNATPSRAGGLLVIPRREEVYFYSIDWSEFWTCREESDKFEMVNALLGLSIFDEYVASYRGGRDVVVLKTDNTFGQNPDSVYRRQRTADWRQFFSRVNSKLNGEPFDGQWLFANKSSDDHLRIADKLSRADHSTSSSLPVAVMRGAGNIIMGYSMYNVSSGHRSLLRGIAGQVPKDGTLVAAQGGGDCQTT